MSYSSWDKGNLVGEHPDEYFMHSQNTMSCLIQSVPCHICLLGLKLCIPISHLFIYPVHGVHEQVPTTPEALRGCMILDPVPFYDKFGYILVLLHSQLQYVESIPIVDHCLPGFTWY